MDVDTFVGKRTRLHAVLFTALTFACNNEPFSAFTDVVPEDVAPPPQSSAGGTTTATGGTGSFTTGGGGQNESGESAGDAGQGQGGSDDVVVAAVAGAGAAPVVGAGAAAGAGGGEVVAIALPELVDDVEGAFPDILELNGRNGFWYWAEDGSGGWMSPLEAVALEPPRPGSYYAAHVSGGGFTSWGALLGVSMLSPFGAYDASAYCAVRFVAQGSGEGWALRFSDSLSEPATGACGSECYNYPGQAFQPSAEWQEFEIRFDELEPAFGGSPRPLESDAVFAIRFAYENTSGAAFDLTIDDLAFVPAAACQ